MPDIAKELKKETTLKARQLNWTAPKANMYYKRNVTTYLSYLFFYTLCIKYNLNYIISKLNNFYCTPLLKYPLIPKNPSNFIRTLYIIRILLHNPYIAPLFPRIFPEH